MRELLDRLTIRGLEILSTRIRHCDHRGLLHLGVIYAHDRRHLFLELEVNLQHAEPQLSQRYRRDTPLEILETTDVETCSLKADKDG